MKTKNKKTVELGPKALEIPKNWEKKELNEVVENLDNVREPIKKSKRTNGNIPYYGATGCIDYVDDYIYDEKLVLVGEDGADWSGQANTTYIVEGKSWVNNHAHVLRCNKIKEEFLAGFMNLMDLTYIIVGTNRGKLNKKDLMSLEVLYPPLSEQEKIAEVLSTVDQAIEKTDNIIEESKMAKKGLMQDLLTKGIGHSEFKEIQLGPKTLEIPEGWSVKKLENVDCKIYAGGTPSRSNKKYFNGNIPWIKSGELNQNFITNIGENITKEALSNSSAKMVPKNNVLIAMYGATAGQVGYLRKKATTNQAVLAIVTEETSLNSLFLYYLLSRNMKKIVLQRQQGTGQQNLSKKLIKSTEIYLPPLPEQKEIAEILSAVDEKIKKEKEYKESLKSLKKGLMQDLLTGKVRVKNI